MKMEDLNAALGTGILPTAKTFGLTLKDVGAALALFTDEGVPADAAATRLRMSMSLLGAPSKIAEKHLRDIGLTGLRLANDMRKPNGIIVAIGDLKKHLDASGLSASEQAQLLSHAFGGGRSSSAILSMVNNYDVLRKKQDQVTASMQKYNSAIAAQRATPAAQFKLLESSLQRSAIMLGNQVLPYLVKLTQWIGNVVEGFNGLSSGTKRFIVIAAGVTAAVGPALAILSRLYLLLFKMPKAMIGWAATFAKSAYQVVQGARQAELSIAAMNTKSYATGLKLRAFFSAIGTAALNFGRYVMTSLRGAGVGGDSAGDGKRRVGRGAFRGAQQRDRHGRPFGRPAGARHRRGHGRPRVGYGRVECLQAEAAAGAADHRRPDEGDRGRLGRAGQEHPRRGGQCVAAGGGVQARP
jgi:hypothetical protein